MQVSLPSKRTFLSSVYFLQWPLRRYTCVGAPCTCLFKPSPTLTSALVKHTTTSALCLASIHSSSRLSLLPALCLSMQAVLQSHSVTAASTCYRKSESHSSPIMLSVASSQCKARGAYLDGHIPGPQPTIRRRRPARASTPTIGIVAGRAGMVGLASAYSVMHELPTHHKCGSESTAAPVLAPLLPSPSSVPSLSRLLLYIQSS